MSKTSLTARDRLALRHWAEQQGSQKTPTVPMAMQWIAENLGKDVEEDTIRSVLNKGDLNEGFHTFDDGELNKLVRPGFGLGVNAIPEKMFPSAVLDWTAITLTYLELAIMWFIEQITNKPDWHVKVFNDDIAAKWKAEVMAVDWTSVGLKYAHFDDDMFEWCLEELRQKAKLYEATGIIPVFDYSAAVIKSDNALTPEIKEELKKAVAMLEDVPDAHKDWHPGSDEKVLDLVHPSLWPLAYGTTRILSDKRIPLADTMNYCGGGDVIPTPDEDVDLCWSTKFQWLPCEVELDDDKPRIASYINNLHPTKHADLYSVIEKVLGKVVPLWDVVHRWPEEFEFQRLWMPKVGRCCTTPEICNKGPYWCRPESRPQEPDEQPREEDEYNGNYEDSDDEPESLTWRRDKIWYNATHPLSRPNIPPYTRMPITGEDVRLQNGFFDNAERIQVIVKLANIHLTPEKPTYDGGSWHIEGLLNEHICATALYYYDNENITESRLAFRTKSNREDLTLELQYEQSDFYSIGRTFSIDPSGNTIQGLGSVLTREDRLIAFPNVYQHCVAPFELVDKTKSGHRKILALFLVDPDVPVISTANVPPQQKHWFRDEVTTGRMPPEIIDMVFENLEIPFGLEKAKEMRLEVMKERTTVGDNTNYSVRSDDFNFCEH
ncbi:hypothetical protein GCG54_00006282 [Colletotrichum gloeosporioides]|uniref:Uncharacterized protein n=1 Tax=Colletotrichum gloeosporioides TaxID=474922 RepID=A0A8H4FLI5_COLGL|nr:uncharacterized protein GCG54_00006282 [Colletotrichum gloeosporioides]KAF3805339.1 hypothetical protein GCG54_00006282 [Colletotrichum gloeosporioides]